MTTARNSTAEAEDLATAAIEGITTTPPATTAGTTAVELAGTSASRTVEQDSTEAVSNRCP